MFRGATSRAGAILKQGSCSIQNVVRMLLLLVGLDLRLWWRRRRHHVIMRFRQHPVEIELTLRISLNGLWAK